MKKKLMVTVLAIAMLFSLGASLAVGAQTAEPISVEVPSAVQVLEENTTPEAEQGPALASSEVEPATEEEAVTSLEDAEVQHNEPSLPESGDLAEGKRAPALGNQPFAADGEQPQMSAMADMILLATPTQTVDSVADLQAAVSSATMDTIIGLGPAFPTGLAGVISLTSNHSYNITITGGDTPITLTAASGQKHFSVSGTGTGTITIDNLILDGGTTSTNSGGVTLGGNFPYIFNNVTFQNSRGNIIAVGSRKVTFNNSVFQNIVGRGITVHGGEVNIYNSLFNNVRNTIGDHGSAIYCEGSLTIDSSSFINSAATFDNNYVQAAITMKSTISLKVTNSYFEKNAGVKYGGAICLYQAYGSASIDNSYFKENSVYKFRSTNADGGAIGVYNNGANATTIDITNSTFEKNTASDDGGALFFEDSSNSYSLTANVTNCTFAGNSGGGSDADTGGAVQLSLTCNANFSNNTFYNNTKRPGGGAIGFHSDYTNTSRVPKVSMQNNVFVGNGAGSTGTMQVGLTYTFGGATMTAIILSDENNLGYDNGAVLDPAPTVASVFGTATPTLAENGTVQPKVGKDQTIIIPTLYIAPRMGTTNIYADAADGVAGTPATDQRGKDSATDPLDAGAVAILSARFDANGGNFGNTGNSYSYSNPVLYNADADATLMGIAADNGSTIIAPAGPANGPTTNSTFVRWDTEADGTGTAYYPPSDSKPGDIVDANDKATDKNVTYYAIWSTPTTINYNVNGGVGAPSPVAFEEAPDSSSQFTARDIANFDPAVDSTTFSAKWAGQTGKSFAGWNSKADGTGTAIAIGDTFESADLEDDMTLYAQWSDDPTYKLIYHINKGESDDASFDYTDTTPRFAGDIVSSLKTLADVGNWTREGYTFGGWATTADSTTQVTSFTMAAEDGHLYAIWTKDPVYTLTYHVNGGTGADYVDPASYLAGAVVNPLKNLADVGNWTREGYTFEGWATTAGSKTPVTSFTMAAEDGHLYAIWVPIPTYTITYDVNGGNGTNYTDPTSYPSGTVVSPLKTITEVGNWTREGYTFGGWATTPDGTLPITSYPILNNNVIVYAIWVPVPVSSTPPASSTPTVTPPASSSPASSRPRPPAVVVVPSSSSSAPASSSSSAPSSSAPAPVVSSAPTISTPQVPQAGITGASWSLFNLIVTILSVLFALVLLIRTLGGKKQQDEELDENGEATTSRKHPFRISGLLSMLAAPVLVILFLILENMRNPMIFFNIYSWLFGIVWLVHFILAIVFLRSYRKEKPEDEEQEQG
ncbi:InlB B-repeat-containing protein [Ruminococcaceae bacterium OttesenSCG-928-A16]|nr:InlB B-repeat-containing protein [Ruminococcaceae bacterium OttesenSCG-928-A16]